jgi:hypothetical protein
MSADTGLGWPSDDFAPSSTLGWPLAAGADEPPNEEAPVSTLSELPMAAAVREDLAAVSRETEALRSVESAV